MRCLLSLKLTNDQVRATCGSALARGNEVILVKGAHATFDRIEVLNGGGITASSTIENDIEEELSEAGEQDRSMHTHRSDTLQVYTCLI